MSLPWVRSLSYRDQSIDLLYKLMDRFLYDKDLRHGRVSRRKELTDPGRREKIDFLFSHFFMVPQKVLWKSIFILIQLSEMYWVGRVNNKFRIKSSQNSPHLHLPLEVKISVYVLRSWPLKAFWNNRKP